LRTAIAKNIGINHTILALSFARLGDAVGNSVVFIIVPLYVAKLPAPWFPFPDSVRIGILIGLYGLVNSMLQPVMGALSDRLGRRKILILFGLLAMALATFSFAFAQRFADLLLLRALQGVGVALSIPASMAIMASASERSTRGGSMGVYSTMRMLGFAVGPLLGGFLYDNFGFSTAFYVGAACITLGALLVQLWVKETKVSVQSPAGPHYRIWDRRLLGVAVVGASAATFMMASDFSMITTLENQFNARLGLDALGFGAAFSGLMVSRLLFQVPLGRLSDHLGRRPLLIGGLLFMVPATILLGAVTTPAQLVVLAICQGIGSAAIAAPAFALGADVAMRGSEGRQMSIITTGFGLGIAIGPLLAGFLAVASFSLPFVVGGLFTLLVAWIVFRYVPETFHFQPAEIKESRDAESIAS
jgi:MFS family permease